MPIITGTSASETLNGTTSPDVISGLGGDDTLIGLAGDDILIGGLGNDTLFFDGGQDSLYGQDDNDLFLMEANMRADAGLTIDGGTGFDVLELRESYSFTSATLSNLERVSINGTTSPATVVMSGSIVQGLADDGAQLWISQSSFNTAQLVVYASDLTEADFSGLDVQLTGGFTFLRFNGVNGSFIGTDVQDYIETGATATVSGGGGNDLIYTDGHDGDVLFRGGAGNDILQGGTGENTLFGGAGVDTMTIRSTGASFYGGDGDDHLLFLLGSGAQSAASTFFGGAGEDRLTFSSFEQTIDFRTSAFRGIETLNFSVNQPVSVAVFKASDLGNGLASDLDVTISDGLTDDSAYVVFKMGAARSFDLSDVTLTANIANAFLQADGSKFEQTITGSQGKDLLNGYGGHDTLIGLSGNDGLFGGYGQDILRGGLGADTLSGGIGADSLFGGAGGDQMTGDVGADILFGGAGNDTIRGDEGIDRVFGEAGDDRLDLFDTAEAGAGEVYRGGAGVDTLNIRRKGSDILDLRDITFGGMEGITVNVFGTNTVGTVLMEAAQLKSGWSGSIDFRAEGSADTTAVLRVLMGDETKLFLGGASVTAAPDAPMILDIRGDASNEVIVGPQAAVTITGNGGNDMLFTKGDGSLARGGAGHDTLRNEASDVTLLGGAGDDIFDVRDGGGTINGGGGTNTLDMSRYELGLTSSENIDLYLGEAWFQGSGEVMLISNITRVIGGARESFLIGWTGNETLFGGAGNDYIIGVDGDDTLFGGVGDDRLYGGNGQDRVFGGAGNDTIVIDTTAGQGGGERYFGGAGSDTLWLERSASGVDQSVDFRTASLGGMEAITFDDPGANQTVTARFLASQINTAFAFGSQIQMASASDATSIVEVFMGTETNLDISGFGVISAANDDRFVVRGNAGTEAITGSGVKDHLFGGAGRDYLNGYLGDDLIVGGLGQDTLTGSVGADTFDFNAVGHSAQGNGDVITDFDAADFLDLSDISVVAGSATNFQMLNIGTKEFSASGSAEFRMDEVQGGGGNAFGTLVQVDSDGDGTADMEIMLNGTLYSDISYTQLIGVYTLF